MKPYQVISAFRSRSDGRRIEPPGPWTPPSAAVAERLVRAGCLKAPADEKPELVVTMSAGSTLTPEKVADAVNAVAGGVEPPDPPKPDGGEKRRRKQ